MKCPVVDQCVAESSVVRPVTVTAEVDVNKASKKLVTVPVLEAIGSMSKKVPRRISAVKAAAINCVDESLDKFGISAKTILLPLKLTLGKASKPLPLKGIHENCLGYCANTFEPVDGAVLNRRLRSNCRSHEFQNKSC